MGGIIILNRITDVAMLKQNIIEIKQSLTVGAKFMLVAKANAYGCGAESVRLVEELVDYYGVARANEGVKLRSLGVSAPILVLSYDQSESASLVQYDLEVAIGSVKEFCHAQSAGISRVHIAIDTGMNRFGLQTLDELVDIFKLSNATKIVGIFSHIYHNSKAVKQAQNKKFAEFVATAKAFTPDILCHIASSGSYIDSSCCYDMARVGLRSYSNCMSVESCIMSIKHIGAFEDVGYNGEFVSTRPMDIAVIQGGYADGIDKRLCKISIDVNGRQCKILGAICMDVFMVDVTGVTCEIGDVVTILNSCNINEAIALSGISEYELLTGLKGRYNYARIDQRDGADSYTRKT